MVEGIISFIAEWFDPQAQINREYYLNYYLEDNIELIDKKAEKTFLKKISFPSITEKDLYVGSIITIYSRQLKIINYANAFTENYCQSKQMNQLILIKPNAFKIIGQIISTFEKNKIKILNLQSIIFDNSSFELLIHSFKISDIQRQEMEEKLCCLIEIAISNKDKLKTNDFLYSYLSEILKITGIKDITEMIFLSYQNNKTSFFVSNSNNKINKDKINNYTNINKVKSCTIGMIRPHIFQDGKCGELIQDIINNGFIISAMKLLRLDINILDTFFNSYKSVCIYYNDLLKHMSSGPCLIMEISSNKLNNNNYNIVHDFQEFCGPFDMEIAKILRPKSLRAKYGKSNLYNAIYCTDCPEDGENESKYFFNDLMIQS